MDAARLGRSVAAFSEGDQYFEPATNIAGAILNTVAQARHASKLQSGIEQHGGIPVIGIVPRDDALTIADRYLGLIPRREYDARATGGDAPRGGMVFRPRRDSGDRARRDAAANCHCGKDRAAQRLHRTQRPRSPPRWDQRSPV